jgi:hypothetical protein
MRRRNLTAAVLGVCAVGAMGGLSRACDYHWALGIPEPTGDWPAMPSPAAATPSASLTSAAQSAVLEVTFADSINDAAITRWMINTTGRTGHSTNATINNLVDKIQADVQTVAYNSTDVYVHATGVPSHDVGPFPGNPAAPSDRNRTVDIPRTPVVNTGARTPTGLGPIGVMVNGVAFFNASDAHSYLNQNVWHQNANVFEASSFDGGPGHPAPDQNSTTTPLTGNYHYHEAPLALLNELDPGNTGQHASPLIGFAFDGFPIFGPYAPANADGTGPIEKMTSSYQPRNITQRTTLPNGTTAAFPGPDVSTQFPIGSYLEDYGFVPNSGTLDQFNGRMIVNADYPQGTYAYFVTTDPAGKGIYPYIIGPQYYGVVQTDNLGAGTITVP